MSKKITARMVTVIIILSGIIVLWFRYRMSPITFYSASLVCIACGVFKLTTVIRSKERGLWFRSLAALLLCGIITGMSFTVIGQAQDFLIQSKTDAYFNKLPIKVFGKEKMSPKDLEFMQQNRPMSDPDLSEAGNTVVYEDKPFNPEHGAITYTVLFKRPYYVDSIDISQRTCVRGVFCTSLFNGSVILDAKTKELLHFSIRNAGGGK